MTVPEHSSVEEAISHATGDKFELVKSDCSRLAPCRLASYKFALKNEPKEFRFFNGLSLWSPGQLEGEINSKCWLVGEITDANLILKTPPRQQYMKAVELLGSQTMNKYI